MFNNEMLNELNAAMPANPKKLNQTMLFVLIDSFLLGNLTPDEFTNDMKNYLGNDKKEKTR